MPKNDDGGDMTKRRTWNNSADGYEEVESVSWCKEGVVV